MPSVPGRRLALAAAVIAVAALPAGVSALDAGAAKPAATTKAKPKPAPAKKRVVRSVRTLKAAPKPPRRIRARSCRGKSRKVIRSRTIKRYRGGGYRVVTRYCKGRVLIQRVYVEQGQATVVTVQVPVGVPVPTEVAVPTPADKALRLTLLHANDFESKLLTTGGYGGAARFATVTQRLRRAADDYSDASIATGQASKATMLVGSGDNFLAGINYKAGVEQNDGVFYDSYAFSRLGFDAVTIGNHDFDFGPNRLADFIQQDTSGAPFLSANLDLTQSPRLKALADAGRIKKSAVFERGGRKVGVIGITPPNLASISSPAPATVTTADIPAVAGAVNAEAAALQAAGANIVILSSHMQSNAADRELLPLLRGVDVTIAGGGDDLLADGDDVLIPGANGVRPTPAASYPQLLTDADGRQVPLVTTQGEYRYVGRLTATFDSAGNLTGVDEGRSGPVRVSGTVADPDVAAEDRGLATSVTAPLNAFSASLAANVLAVTDDNLDGSNQSGDAIRRRETNLGNLVADGFLWSGRRDAANNGRPAPDVAFTNSGGIRASVPAGNVSELDTFSVLAFDNTMGTVTVTRERFKRLLEHGVTSVPNPDGRFPQIAGFRFVYNSALPVGSRVRDVTLIDGGEVIVDDGVVQDPSAQISIVTTSFTAANGDGYPFDGAPFQSFQPVLGYQQTLADYLVAPTAEGGLGRVVSDAADYQCGRVDRISNLAPGYNTYPTLGRC